jgi:hypothetical protein
MLFVGDNAEQAGTGLGIQAVCQIIAISCHTTSAGPSQRANQVLENIRKRDSAGFVRSLSGDVFRGAETLYDGGGNIARGLRIG